MITLYRKEKMERFRTALFRAIHHDGMSQREIASIMGVNESLVSSFLSGSRDSIAEGHIVTLYRATGKQYLLDAFVPEGFAVIPKDEPSLKSVLLSIAEKLRGLADDNC